ncbi:MAG: phosphopentomutase, partial [candidate division Zixibacteria bacterium]|nr:phosphopentomutase [candidate division Zixibacteria bacterium]
MKSTRTIILILDACGVGELPDAAQYGDAGSATLPNLARAVGGLRMPHSQRLGLGNIATILGVDPAERPAGSFGRMAEASPGKDSTAGHWEIGGVVIDEPFPMFPHGFPKELVARFEAAVGVKTIGNIAASGTEIIEKLGAEHLKTGALILYTSADSVFQVAAHESVYPIERQYKICKKARELCVGPYNVGRVIARPFVGEPGGFVRTPRRKDFSRLPPSDTLLDVLTARGDKVLSICMIYDLFAGRGITTAIKTANNAEVMEQTIEAVSTDTEHALIFANLVDFDQLWGHRNDEGNFAKALEAYDRYLGELLEVVRDDDMLLITADHGCDPTIKSSTDHSREYVPLIVYGRGLRSGIDLGIRATFADVA